MDVFKLKFAESLYKIEEQEKEAEDIVKKYTRNLKKFTKKASDKMNQSLVNEMINKSIEGKSILTMTRRELRDLNNSRGENEAFIVPKVLDVSDIMRARRTLNRSRNTTFIKNESMTANATFTKNDSRRNNTTFTLSRDYVTPDNDSPMNEIRRKLIEEEINRSVTRRNKGLRKVKNREGTPLAAEESNDLNSNDVRPKKNLNEIEKEAGEDSESTIELQALDPIQITLDDIDSDISIDTDLDIDEEAELENYPKWSRFRRELAKRQSHIDTVIIDVFFCQFVQPDAKELFPNSNIQRRRSTMWELH